MQRAVSKDADVSRDETRSPKKLGEGFEDRFAIQFEAGELGFRLVRNWKKRCGRSGNKFHIGATAVKVAERDQDIEGSDAGERQLAAGIMVRMLMEGQGGAVVGMMAIPNMHERVQRRFVQESREVSAQLLSNQHLGECHAVTEMAFGEPRAVTPTSVPRDLLFAKIGVVVLEQMNHRIMTRCEGRRVDGAAQDDATMLANGLRRHTGRFRNVEMEMIEAGHGFVLDLNSTMAFCRFTTGLDRSCERRP